MRFLSEYYLCVFVIIFFCLLPYLMILQRVQCEEIYAEDEENNMAACMKARKKS